MVDWSGRHLALGKPGVLPAELLPLVASMDLDVEHWLTTVSRYGSLFHRIAGKLEALSAAAKARGKRWLAGVRSSQMVYSKPVAA